MEKDEVGLVELQKYLQCEGLGPEASSSERLAVLWRLYVRKEESVKKLTQEIQELRTERAAEINTVQQYVENIRTLSKTRDSVALELERDNETLRTKLDEICLQQEAQRSEIVEMLLQEGLAEVIPSSLSEQVAYLLAERASLLEKLHSLEAVDPKASQKSEQKTSPQSPEDNTDKVMLLRGQSPLKRLLGIKKAAQSKQTPVVYQGSDSEQNALQEREHWLLKRDLDEASSRLDMAHKEIRRLTDELESARLTQSAYEPELQEAQIEVEQLRQEVEKLKRCDVAELRRAKEINEALDAEVHQLRESVQRLQTECFQLLQLIDSKIEDLDSEDDEFIQNFFQKLLKNQVTSTGSLSKGKKKKEKDIHKRCCEELEEKLNILEDQRLAVLKLQTQLEEEKMLRKKAVEECNEQSKRRTEAEQLILELQALCEQKEEEHKARVQPLQEELVSLDAELGELKSALHQEREQARQQHTVLQVQTDQAKVFSQSQEHLLLQARAQCNQLNKELQRTQCLLKNTKEDLLSQSERKSQLQRNISVLQQENLKIVSELQEAQEKVKHMEEKETHQAVELQTLQQKLQMHEAQQDHDKFLLQREQEELNSSRVQITSMEKEIKDLEKQLKSTTQQLCHEKAQHSSLEEKVKHMLEELVILKTHAEHAQKQSEYLAVREMELQHQVQSLLDANTQLSLAKAEMNHQLQERHSKEQNELRQVIEKLEDRLMCSQQECERLHIQLQQTQFTLQAQISNYEEKKIRHKEKLSKAKDFYLRETSCRDEKITEQQRQLSVLGKRVEKGNEMMKKITAENEALLLNKKKLLCQLNEEEEERKHAVATVTAIQQRVDFLEKDSVTQRNLNMMKSKQITHLEGLLLNMQCLMSTEDLKKFSFENRIIEGSEQASTSEHRLDTCDLVAVVQKTKSRSTEEAGMDYLN